MPERLPPPQPRPKPAPFAPGAFSRTPIITTTTPSDSRCPPPDFTIGLYERSLLTRLDRPLSLVPRTNLARLQVSVPRKDPPHPIRNQDWRTWPSPRHERLGSPIVSPTRLQSQPTRSLPPKRLSTPRSALGVSPSSRRLLPDAPALTRTGLSPAGLTQLPRRNTAGAYPLTDVTSIDICR